MSKIALVTLMLVGLCACETYSGRTTNCWGGAALSFAKTPISDAPAPGCGDWIVISD